MKKPLFFTVCLTPTLQRTLVLPKLVPDAVNRIGRHRFDASGKGMNVSRVLTQLGRDCIHLTQLGGSLRPVFLELCASDGVKVEWVDSGSPIRFAYTVIDNEKQQVTELVEEAERVGEGTEERLLEAFDRLIPEASWLIISGSKAAGFSDGLVPELVRRAKEQGCSVMLDIRGPDLLNSLPHRPDLIKPNLEEFAATFASQTASAAKGGALSREKAEKLTAELWAEYGCCIVITRGAEHIWYADAGKLDEFPVEAVEPFNTTGSGDAFTAGLASALSDGVSLREALAEANRCGRLNAVVLQPGAIR